MPTFNPVDLYFIIAAVVAVMAWTIGDGGQMPVTIGAAIAGGLMWPIILPICVYDKLSNR